VPGTNALPEEVVAVGEALGRAGHGVFQLVSDQQGAEPERTWLTAIARETGRNVVYSLAQAPYDPTAYKRALADAEVLAGEGLTIAPMVSCRPTGMLFGLQSSLHPFITHPSYRDLADLPLAERVARLRDPEVRARLLAEDASTGNVIARTLMSRWDQMFPLGDPPEYEPAPDTSVAATAEREHRRPEEVVLDWLLERDGKALIFAPLASYVDRDHEALREMMTHPRTVLGLSDGGAHCGLICDASMPTYLLTHWVRDRTRGPRLGVEETVRMQTGRTAAVYGLDDRGVLAPGKRADINLIDLDGLRLHAPEMVFDLPAGGRRLVQHVDGYKATLCAGAVTFSDGEATGERPGTLVRGGAQPA
jgi:N-acyl-D-aspartate/D-glutamate deacylase